MRNLKHKSFSFLPYHTLVNTQLESKITKELKDLKDNIETMSRVGCRSFFKNWDTHFCSVQEIEIVGDLQGLHADEDEKQRVSIQAQKLYVHSSVTHNHIAAHWRVREANGAVLIHTHVFPCVCPCMCTQVSSDISCLLHVYMHSKGHHSTLCSAPIPTCLAYYIVLIVTTATGAQQLEVEYDTHTQVTSWY